VEPAPIHPKNIFSPSGTKRDILGHLALKRKPLSRRKCFTVNCFDSIMNVCILVYKKRGNLAWV